jgi:Ser/Thr protein kinase RdoA (MazF antagonist)
VRSAGAGFDPAEALRSWDITKADIVRSSQGLNNESWFVQTRRGRFVLRLYGTADEGDVAAEHALLIELDKVGLPFAIPRPVSPRGSPVSWARVATLAGPRLAALFEWIPGEHLNDEDVQGLEAAAAALAGLDAALASATTDRVPFSGGIETVHPKVEDLDSLDELGADGAAFVRRMREASELRGALRPRQIIHGDFAFGNVLLADGRISGILDFEVAAEDARAAELAVALRLVLSKHTRDRLWRPLLRGYLRSQMLTRTELDALPVLAMQHDAVVLVWWLGRFRDGIRDVRPLRDRVAEGLDRERWIRANSESIIAYARSLLD